MKKLSVPACASLALSLILAVGSQTFLAPCVHDDGSFGSCHWAGQALLGCGGLLAALSLMALLWRQPAGRAALFAAMLPAAALGGLIPGALIALCRMDTMRCRAVTQPAAILLCALIGIIALAGLILENNAARKRSV